MPRPLALSDAQYSAVVEACEPLLPVDRGRFLQELAAVLGAAAQPLGDGEVTRAIRSLQGRYFRPPTATSGPQPARRVVGPAIE
jgi:hypothetical protein